MNKYYDYCDAYDTYGTYGTYESGRVLDDNNKIKTFTCGVCKQSKLVLKKSVGDDSVFKCNECIEASLNYNNNVEQNQAQQDQTQTQESRWRWFSFF